MFNNADIKFGTIKDESGTEAELTKGRYAGFVESSNPEVRRQAYNTLYKAYGQYKNTLAATITASIKKDNFYAGARKYESALVAALHEDNVDKTVYDNLIDSVHHNLDKMYRYVKLRKKALGLEELHFYDLYCPIVKDVVIKKTFDEAKEMVLEALRPMGSDYLSVIKEAFRHRWVDVCENVGKASGAYSWGVYGVHPYVLLNYQGTLHDVFTLAHEMGHAMHSHYSQKNQPYVYAHYKIFVAEVASTLNEALLMHYLLENNSEINVRKYLLNHYLEQFRSTLYRQTMFAEFEKMTHNMVDSGEALTQEKISTAYKELNVLYYGPDIVVDDSIALEWSRIPHFYTPFYVYKYATGISAATALALNILSGNHEALDNYMQFLGSGGSDYPLDLLIKAGVDLRTSEPVDKALNLFGDLVSEMEKLI
jgi:oligoendopeptidase F